MSVKTESVFWGPGASSPVPKTAHDARVAGDSQIFILGPARSGTSILYFSLKDVFNVPGLGEGHVFPIIQSLLHQFHSYNLKYKGAKDMLASRLDTDSFRVELLEFIRKFYFATYKDGGWIDKTPGSEAIMGAELILEAFPSARVFVMRRTGVEFVQSFTRKFSVDFETACREWVDCMKCVIRLRSSGLPVLELDQFDIANAPEATAARIADHLGQPERAAPLAAFFRGERVEKTSNHDWSRRLTVAEADWSAEQKAVFRRVCGAHMKQLNYPLD